MKKTIFSAEIWNSDFYEEKSYEIFDIIVSKIDQECNLVKSRIKNTKKISISNKKQVPNDFCSIISWTEENKK
jgi:hypothetical protein